MRMPQNGDVSPFQCRSIVGRGVLIRTPLKRVSAPRHAFLREISDQLGRPSTKYSGSGSSERVPGRKNGLRLYLNWDEK